MPYTHRKEGNKNCVYKKDGGAKVGCTKGDVKKYLAALHANANESVTESNTLKGGKADKMSIEDIAKKFNTSVDKIKAQIQKGVKVEMEHTSDKEKASEIATDHVSEFPDYYDRLDKMEGKAKKDWEKINENNKTLIKKLFRENINNPKKKRTLHESFVNGKTIINVDIQPEYQKWITFDLTQWVEFINESSESNRIVFLYNGEDTLGMVSLSDYQMWLMDLGIDDSIIDSAIFYDKGYAFFRYCMDNSIDENDVAQLVRFMISHNINDSRDINEEMWNQFMETTNNSLEEIRGLLENAGDMISIPDLMGFLGEFSNIVLTGGGINECLKEVEIALLAMNKPFNILNQFTY
jgi:hypothetical protein